jgi:1,2-diacylglycerol 3-alpha-glucosyltransferase
VRIGLFTDIYLPSVFGTELATERVRRTLEAMGHRVYVYAPETPGFVDEGRRVLRFRSQRMSANPAARLAFSFLPVGRSYRDVLSLRLDVAQAQTVGAMGMLARRIAQHQGIPLLYAHHSMYPAYAGSESADAQLVPSLVRTYTKWFAGRADAILAPTPKVKRLLADWGVEVPVHLLPTGVDRTVFHRSAAARRRVRRELGIAEDRVVLLVVSRLVREKNLDFLLEAFRRVVRTVPSAVLLVAGEGPHRAHLERHAHRLGIGARTHFAGLVPHETVASVYQAADLFVFPSVIESQGLVVLEALSSGLPVVALKDEAYAEFVTNGVTGRLVTPRAPAAFAAAVRELARDPALRARESRAAARLAAGYTLETMAERLVEIYHDTIRSVGGRAPRRGGGKG